MNRRDRRALGDQAIHLIRETAKTCTEIDRAALRAKIDAASIRPTPGTSDLLARSVSGELPGTAKRGPKTVKVYDLTGMMLVHLKKGNYK